MTTEGVLKGRESSLSQMVGPFLEISSERDGAAINAALDAGDVLLAFLATSTAPTELAMTGARGATRELTGNEKPSKPVSWLAGIAGLAIKSAEVAKDAAVGSPRTVRWVLTAKQSALVFLAEEGVLERVPLPAESLSISREVGRDSISAGRVSWRPTLANEGRFGTLAELPGLPLEDRLRRAAWLNFCEKSGREESVRILEALTRASASSLDAMTLEWVRHGRLPKSFETLARELESSEVMIGWCRDWKLEEHQISEILACLLADDAPEEWARWCLPFHRWVWEERRADLEVAERAAWDVEFAEHLMACGQRLEASSILESALAGLPFADLTDLVSDLESGGLDPRGIRVRILDALAIARGDRDLPDEGTLWELARLQPLSIERLERLKSRVSGDRANRVVKAVDVIAGRTVARSSGDDDAAGVAPLGKRDLDEVVRHPAVRASGTMARLASMLAAEDRPEGNLLSGYCDRVKPGQYPSLERAVEDACVALGLQTPTTFLSRGSKSRGVRAFAGQPPTLIVGCDHVLVEGAALLSPRELRFAIGSELASVYFEHPRVTSKELVKGIWKATEGVGSVLAAVVTIAPVMAWMGKASTYRLVRRAIPLPWLKAVYGVNDGRRVIATFSADPGKLFSAGTEQVRNLAGQVAPRALDSKPEMEPASGGSVGAENYALLKACQPFALTADRFGLLLCGDLASAVRAMFLTNIQLAPDLPLAARAGLLATLGRRSKSGALIHEDFATRVGALISFWLSEDFVLLSRRVLPANGTRDARL